jgi:gluconokinase
VSETLALGVDLGTGSARAFLFDESGKRHGGVRIPYAWRLTPDGGVEADPDALVEITAAAIDGALAAVAGGAIGRVRAVGFSALWHTLLGVDAEDRPVTPAYAWSDTRATGTARRLRTLLDEDAVHARTGAMIHPSYPLARLAWLADAEPERFARANRWVSVPEYLWLRLTGEIVVDLSIAAGSGLLDMRTSTWDAELLHAAGIGAEALSPLAAGDACAVPAAGSMAAARWPALRRAVWRLPVGDGACANIGSGCIHADRMALTVGTSAAVRVRTDWSDVASPPPGLWAYRLDPGHALVGAATSNGGVVRQWLLRTLQLPGTDAELDAALAERAPAAHGIVALPFLAGERSPDWPLDATAVLAGLRLGTTPLDIMQAGLEAVAYRIAILRRRILAAMPDSTIVVASGAAFESSRHWPQLIADVLGEEILLSEETEASSRGAALLAHVAAGALGSIEDAPLPETRTVAPVPARHTLHRAALIEHMALDAASAEPGSRR